MSVAQVEYLSRVAQEYPGCEHQPSQQGRGSTCESFQEQLRSTSRAHLWSFGVAVTSSNDFGRDLVRFSLTKNTWLTILDSHAVNPCEPLQHQGTIVRLGNAG